MPKRLTRPTRLILEWLLDRYRSGEPTWGFEIASQTGLKGGTVYPVISRLEEEGWVEASWDDSKGRGPRRRLYRLTAGGATSAATWLEDRPLDLQTGARWSTQ